jgi:hypothetical protein
VISGTALDASTKPLARTTVQIRNLQTHQVEHAVTSNQLGQFTFTALPDIPYIVEIVDAGGHVVAVGEAITVHAGDLAAVSVSVPARMSSMAGLFGTATGSVVLAAASVGLTAVNVANLPPVSPEK